MSPTPVASFLCARVVRGVNEGDILALGLPDDYDFDSALRVAKVGLQELDLVRIP